MPWGAWHTAMKEEATREELLIALFDVTEKVERLEKIETAALEWKRVRESNARAGGPAVCTTDEETVLWETLGEKPGEKEEG